MWALGFLVVLYYLNALLGIIIEEHKNWLAAMLATLALPPVPFPGSKEREKENDGRRLRRARTWPVCRFS